MYRIVWLLCRFRLIDGSRSDSLPPSHLDWVRDRETKVEREIARGREERGGERDSEGREERRESERGREREREREERGGVMTMQLLSLPCKHRPSLSHTILFYTWVDITATMRQGMYSI